MPGNAMVRGFRVNYKRHVLSMDDLQTLYGPNWLNDQVGRSARPPGGAALRGSGAGGGVVPLTLCPFSLLRAQVMNMYGDLVMDTVPDKVRALLPLVA
uniref:Uncharacterized protein n=1 Tax=Chelydra serpentina TaxID=8475 RepID=A0A8C3XMB3_CHESE